MMMTIKGKGSCNDWSENTGKAKEDGLGGRFLCEFDSFPKDNKSSENTAKTG